ncbi:transmembrane protein, putative, partial [Bodo saltans]
NGEKTRFKHVSEITENSPPDAISTNWYVKLQEIPTNKSEDVSNYASLKVPLRIYSQYVTPPQIQCDSAVFTWVRRTLVVPTYCGTSSQYDDDCNRYLTEGNQIQTVAVLHGFRIAFANTERLDDFVWTKDNDAVYLVTSVDAVSIYEDPAKADGGCIFHSLLLREITVGDVIHSESDLMWMPEVSGVAPYRYHGAGGYQLCKTRHSRLQLAVIVGEDIACSFTVSAPPPPPASAYHLIQAFESRLLNSYDAERSSSAGSFVIPFTLHDVVLAQTKDVATLPEASTRAFTLIPNIASQALTLGYANGVITYPQKIISQHKSIYIPSDPFPPEPPQAVKQAYDGSDDFFYAVHLRRQLAAVVTSLSSAYPSRRLAFSSKTLDSNADDEMILVDLRRDDKQGLSVTRSSVRCAPANGEPEPFKGKHELLSDLQQNFFTSFTGRDGAAYADADLLAPMPLWRIEESFEVFISSSGTVETLYFANDERSSWLVVTRHPKLMSVVSHYDSPNTAPWWTKAVAKASNGSKLPVRPTETAFVEQCAALAIQVGVADDVLQQAAGEIVGYADDVLGVAVTDGRAVSPEVLILLRIARPLSSGGNHNDGFSDSAVRSMDAPLLILCVLVCISVLLYYRRKIRRWVHRLDAVSDSSEDIEEQRRVSEHRSEGILKTIKSMVATKSTAAFSRLNNGRSHQAVSHLSDDDDDEMVDVTVRAPLSVVAAAPAADESDDWDDWESAGCAPHAAVAAPARSTEPAPLKSTAAAAPPATKVHPPPPRKGNKKD